MAVLGGGGAESGGRDADAAAAAGDAVSDSDSLGDELEGLLASDDEADSRKGSLKKVRWIPWLQP